jgi:AraC family transcriptional regulator
MHAVNEPGARVGGDAAASRRAVAGIGRVLLWSGGSLWMGREGGATQAHAHHAIQITLALSGSVLLSAEDGGAESGWREYTGAIVMPDRLHRFDGQGQEVAMLFVAAETAQGQALVARHGTQAITPLPEATVAAMAQALRRARDAALHDDALRAEARAALALLAGSDPGSGNVDPRIARAIAWIRASLGGPVTLEQAAAQAHLSPSRFRHLFVAQTGVSFRAYLLWARVETAVALGMGGQSWTVAAQDAGFADSAHLSRTCRRMFGIAPAMLVRERAG